VWVTKSKHWIYTVSQKKTWLLAFNNNLNQGWSIAAIFWYTYCHDNKLLKVGFITHLTYLCECPTLGNCWTLIIMNCFRNQQKLQAGDVLTHALCVLHLYRVHVIFPQFPRHGGPLEYRKYWGGRDEWCYRCHINVQRIKINDLLCETLFINRIIALLFNISVL